MKLDGIKASLLEIDPEFPIFEIKPSPRTEHYRNRMDFCIDFEGRFGLREKGKWWKIIDGHKCFISDPKIEEAFEQVKAWLPQAGLTYYCRKKHLGFLRYALIRATKAGQLQTTIISSAPRDDAEKQSAHAALIELSQRLKPAALIWGVNNTDSDTSWSHQSQLISGAFNIVENIGGIQYRISSNTFFQTNSHAAEVLLASVLELVSELKAQSVLDLYCGTGFFTIPLAKRGSNVTGVEISEDSINEAKLNNELNASQARFVCIKSEEFVWGDIKPDLLLLDPPRSGLHKDLIQQIRSARPKNLLYVSCNFKRFAEELMLLKDIYRPLRSFAVDLFPHTQHVELVTLLEAL